MSLKSHNSIKQMSYLKKIAKEEKYKGIILYGIMLIKTSTSEYPDPGKSLTEGSIYTVAEIRKVSVNF